MYSQSMFIYRAALTTCGFHTTLHRIIKAECFIKPSVEINRPRHVEINRPWHVEINTDCQSMRFPTWWWQPKKWWRADGGGCYGSNLPGNVKIHPGFGCWKKCWRFSMLDPKTNFSNIHIYHFHVLESPHLVFFQILGNGRGGGIN